MNFKLEKLFEVGYKESLVFMYENSFIPYQSYVYLKTY